MKVSVIGIGYVGIVTGACLADKGHKVICVDIDEEKVRKINQSIPPIYERGLAELLKKNVPENLSATVDLQRAVLETEISLIAVGTPFDGKEIDLTQVKEVSRQVGKGLACKTDYHVVAVKSTVVPGTTDGVVLSLLEESSGKRAGIDFGLGMNPEFLREGEAVEDFLIPDRIVIGGIDSRSRDTLKGLYASFPGTDIIVTNNKTAEMTKYTSNALLATMISFSNEIGNMCAATGGIDVEEVMAGVFLDKRFCPILNTGERIVPQFTTYLKAGCGFGGSCFPKDVKALIAYGKRVDGDMSLLQAVLKVNEDQPRKVVSLLKKEFPSLQGVPVAVLGLAFKPGTDDVRESPSIPIIQNLLDLGASIKAYDPVAMNEAKKILGTQRVEFCDDLYQAVSHVEAVVLITAWEAFRTLPEYLAGLNPQPLFIDGRRMLNKTSIARYRGIGMREER